MVRTNLVVMTEEGYEDLPEFYAKNKVEVVCSLPCYTMENVEYQRGKGTYEPSIAVLRKLNALGYGSDPELVLNLVYNPGGAFCPPPQQILEEEYKAQLKQAHGIVFNNLFTITNNPIGRFGDFLCESGELGEYMDTLYTAFNSAALPHMMCRFQLSVGWDGKLYDCDFNQAL